MCKIIFTVILFFSACLSQTTPNPDGYREIPWGSSAAQATAVLTAANVNLVQLPNNRRQGTFPEGVNLARYQIAQDTVAGYPARTTLYFFDDRFFQAVVTFNFDRFKNYDFNFNVFISVDRYYNDIRATTLNFVSDVYVLLAQKYGRKQPTFRGIDPRHSFVDLDNYIAQERWNLRYNPSEFYRRISTQSFAQWRFPETEVRFSVTISAYDKRFEYILSLASVRLIDEVERAIGDIRRLGL